MSISHLLEDKEKPWSKIRVHNIQIDGGHSDFAMKFNGTLPESTSLSHVLGVDSSTGHLTRRAVSSMYLYDAIIPDHYALLSDAIADGKSNIYIRDGTYTESSNITIPENTSITGQSTLNTIIDFGGVTNKFIIGTDTAYDVGTVTMTNGSTTLTGTGTTFTAGMAGKYICVGDLWYLISAFVSATELTLFNIYEGETATDIEYFIIQPVFNVNISNLSIYNNTTTTTDEIIRAHGWGNSKVEGVYFYDTGTIFNRYSSMMLFSNLVFDGKDGTGRGIWLGSCGATRVVDSTITRCATALKLAVATNFTTTNVKIDNCICSRNDAIGIDISTGRNITVSNCTAEYNTDNGLLIRNTVSENISITGGSYNNNGHDGINGGSGTKDDVRISSVSARNNAGYGIYVNGQYHISNCVCEYNGERGMFVTGNDSQIVNCRLSNNTQAGAVVSSQNSMVMGCRVYDNGDEGLYIGGDGCMITNNICTTNTKEGIRLQATANTIATNNRCILNDIGINVVTGSSNCIVSGNRCNSNTTSNFTDSGTGTVTNGDNLTT